LLTVARSYGRDTTKGGHADVIPIARELVAFLRDAIERSPSALVFPADDGSMRSSHTPLEDVLRRAMRHAGIVLGYLHVCRKKGCIHRERAADAALRRCPVHTMKLWPKAELRPIRFHDLRHTTASLLMMAGANTVAVQRILRHRDPRLTVDVYGHLAPNYLRSEIDRLKFYPDDSQPEAARSVTGWLGPASAEATENAPLGPMVVQGSADELSGDAAAVAHTRKIPVNLRARHAGVEPATYGSGGDLRSWQGGARQHEVAFTTTHDQGPVCRMNRGASA
jgi:hypothetical protein